MLRRPWVIIGVLAATALAAWLAFGFFGIQALWIDQTVNEDFPTTVAQPIPTAAPTKEPQPTAIPTAVPTSAPEATQAPTTIPTDVPPTDTPEPTAVPTPSGPVLVSAGKFHNAFHKGVGDALVYQQPDGSYLLRLENFDIENGPDLYIYAVAAEDSYEADTVLNAGYIDLGRLKGNVGNQNYVLPAEFDPFVHRSITVWCLRFTVNFVTAPLQLQ